MLTQLLPAACAALLGVAAGGSIAGLSRPIAWWQLGVASLTVQLLLSQIPVARVAWLTTYGPWVWAAALAVVFLVLLRNVQQESGAHRLPWLVAALGVGLNLLVIVANNGYMPVPQSALFETSQLTELASHASFHRDVLLDADTRLPWLADVLADPSWLPHPLVASIGDRLLSVGLAGWALMSVYSSRRRSGSTSRQLVA
jgi:hypothetical protein